MKNKFLFKSIICFLILLTACDEGIDPISEVDPGPDTSSPSVEILSPNSNVIIPFTDSQTNLDIQVRAEDDIEIVDVKLYVDGNLFQSFDNFLDYRIFSETFTFENMEVGSHTIEFEATDIVGNLTTDSFTFQVDNTYTPERESEVLYMPFFDGIYTDLISETDPQVVGSPQIVSGGYSGLAYEGAEGAYLTFPTTNLTTTNEFSAVFWYKVNAEPDRAGILVIGPPDVGNANFPDSQNLRSKGFRLFRENAGGMQRIKLNVGNGSADNWFDGGAAADIDPAANEWVQIAFTISETECVVYINGEIVRQNTFSGIDWTDCDVLSIMSGAPRFTGWNHLSDASMIDELRLYNEALTQQDIQNML